MDNSCEKPEFIVTGDGSHTLKSMFFQVTYHSVKGAVNESNHVFINNGLLHWLQQTPAAKVRVFEMGFGTGLNTYLTMLKSKELGVEVDYHAVEPMPINPEDAAKLNYSDSYYESARELFATLHSCEWNVTQRLSDCFQFTKYKQRFQDFKTEQRFDVIYFDAFSPADQPELWTLNMLQKVADLLMPGGLFVTYSAQGQMKRHLKELGLTVKALPGPAGKREMTVAYKA